MNASVHNPIIQSSKHRPTYAAFRVAGRSPTRTHSIPAARCERHIPDHHQFASLCTKLSVTSLQPSTTAERRTKVYDLTIGPPGRHRSHVNQNPESYRSPSHSSRSAPPDVLETAQVKRPPLSNQHAHSNPPSRHLGNGGRGPNVWPPSRRSSAIIGNTASLSRRGQEPSHHRTPGRSIHYFHHTYSSLDTNTNDNAEVNAQVYQNQDQDELEAH